MTDEITSPEALAEAALEFLRAGADRPQHDERVDAVLRALAEHLVDVDDPASEFDLMTLSALVEGTLPPDEMEAATAGVRANRRKLQQFVELSAVHAAFEDDAAPTAEPSLPTPAFVPAVAPVIDLAERRISRQWAGAAAALAALLMVGLFLVVTAGPQIPGPLEAMASSTVGPTLRSGTWQVGGTLEITARVDPGVSWAVVAVAGPVTGQSARVWVARTASVDGARTDDGRVVYRETVTRPAGRRAYIVVASREPLDALPVLTPDWEQRIRQSDDPQSFTRDLEAILDAEAGPRAWRVSIALSVAVAEDELGL